MRGRATHEKRSSDCCHTIDFCTTLQKSIRKGSVHFYQKEKRYTFCIVVIFNCVASLF